MLWNLFDSGDHHMNNRGTTATTATTATTTHISSFKGHNNAVLQACWSPDSKHICSVSADKSVMVWDSASQRRVRRYSRDHHHDAIVNSCSSVAHIMYSAHSSADASHLFVTGSDDRTAKLFDVRCKQSVHSLSCQYPVLSVAMSADEVFTAGVDEVIKVWDRRMNTVTYTMSTTTTSSVGAVDGTITGIQLSPDGNSLLSCSMDGSLCLWNVKPFFEGSLNSSAPVASSRLIKQIAGAVTYGPDKNLVRCAWSSNGKHISCGSADIPNHVYVWDCGSCSVGNSASTVHLRHRLPGHRDAVNDVAFHPTQPILASASSDHTVILSELEHI